MPAGARSASVVPVYTATTDGYPGQVPTISRRVVDGVHEYQTEWPLLSPPWAGSPGSRVA